MSVFLAVCVRFSLHRGRGWEGEVSKWFLFCSCLVFSRSFVHDCKTAKCFPKQGEPKLVQIRAKSKAALKFDISRLSSQTFNWRGVLRISTVQIVEALCPLQFESYTRAQYGCACPEVPCYMSGDCSFFRGVGGI